MPQLPLPRHLLWFRVGLSVKYPALRVCAGQSPGRCRSASRNLARYCCHDLSMIGRSCGRLRDSGTTWRFLGSDAAAGLSLLLAGGGLAVRWLDCSGERGWVMAINDSCEGTGAGLRGLDEGAGGGR